MAAIDWTTVVEEAPASELATFAPGAQFIVLEYVNTKLVVSGFDGEDGVKTRLARIYLAAHMATMLKRKGIAGARSAQSAGGVSESFSIPTMPWLGIYAQTSYGQLFAMIAGSSAHRAGLLLTRRVFVQGTGIGGMWGNRGDDGDGGA